MSRPSDRAGGPRWLAVAILALALAALADGARLWWPRTVDDAFIVFRYSWNLAAGNGPVFNPGERVEGYSSPSWMALSAAALGAGLDPVPLAKLGGLASAAVLLGLVFVELRRCGAPGWGAAAGALVLGSSLVLQIWSVSGLETTFYAVLVFGGLARLAHGVPTPRAAWTGSALLAAAGLTRPEGPLLWALALPLALPGGRSGLARRLRAYLWPGAALVVHEIWRWLYYGDVLANTFHAKTGGGVEMWRQGLHGLSGFVTEAYHLPWLAAALLGAAYGVATRATRRPALVLAAFVVLHVAWVASVGDDGLRVHRFYVPVLAPLAWLAGLLFRREAPRALAALGLAATLAAATLSFRELRRELVPAMRSAGLAYQEGNAKLGRRLAAERDPDTLIAVAAAGAIPYYSRLPAIDLYGLNDRTIARRPFPAASRGRLMKWDHEYALGRRPQLIAINRGYFRAGDPRAEEPRRRPGMLAAAPMDRELFAAVARDGSYRLHALDLGDGSVFWVFERVAP